ncbi:Aspartic proteinase-like protein 1 [Triticum urartu]|uniref:Aspartic proteinase-like protein 1 n=1 Tax=Triticum urartu TaxID=4572 RepID=M7YG33_TRIUA|nr:Aspartic proteinase-like protein 1 [Triticum urartu]
MAVAVVAELAAAGEASSGIGVDLHHRSSPGGSLHYAEVAVGTPNATFLVALDTGSDLFWVPCDCKQCAPIANASELRGGPELRPYSPGKSSTSKAVTCEHALCERPNACAANNSTSCPYTVSPTYNISVAAMTVEGKELAAEFAAVVDSGTSFTYLNDPAYTELATSFDSQYCYQLARGQTELFVPEVSLTTRGGAVFPVTRPFVLIAGETSDGQMVAVGYCLAVLKNDITIDIIGQNFMTGLKVVFDRERSVLGWHEFDCYKDVEKEGHGGSPGAAPGPSPTTRIKPRQSETTPYPGAVPVTPRQAGSGGSRLSFSLALLLPLLAYAAAVV